MGAGFVCHFIAVYGTLVPIVTFILGSFFKHYFFILLSFFMTAQDVCTIVLRDTLAVEPLGEDLCGFGSIYAFPVTEVVTTASLVTAQLYMSVFVWGNWWNPTKAVLYAGTTALIVMLRVMNIYPLWSILISAALGVLTMYGYLCFIGGRVNRYLLTLLNAETPRRYIGHKSQYISDLGACSRACENNKRFPTV